MSLGRDSAGRPTSITEPWGTTGFTYDANGLLATVTDSSGGVFNLGYDPLGRLSSLSRPNGVSDAYTYDNAGQFSSRASAKGSAVVDSLSYSYDSTGNRTSQKNSSGTTTYGYDTADRLISVLAPADSTLPNETFTYDAVGNQTNNGQHYDAANRLLSDAKFDYSYDNEGNQTGKVERATGKTTTYTWNALHQMTSAKLPDGTVVSYRYDALGRRVEQSSSASTTRYVNLGANIVAEYDGANVLRASYLTTLTSSNEPGMPLEVSVGSTISYPLLDGADSVTGMTNAAGTLAQTFAYSAYGQPVGSSAGTYSYGTYAYDSADGLYYARARYYDPADGRFLSEDPKPAANKYIYSHASPETWVDPSGEIPVRGLLCAGACAFSIFTSSLYLERSGFEGFQKVADKVAECIEQIGDKGIEEAEYELVLDELTAADATALAAEVAPVGAEWIVMVVVETDDLIVIVVFEG